jgi:hypothetical protein
MHATIRRECAQKIGDPIVGQMIESAPPTLNRAHFHCNLGQCNETVHEVDADASVKAKVNIGGCGELIRLNVSYEMVE